MYQHTRNKFQFYLLVIMRVNLPVRDYYPPDGKFLDPMYKPYERKTGKDGCPYNPWKDKNLGSCPEQVYPELVRKGWGRSFQRKHPTYSCPAGYMDMGNGYCQPHTLENDGGIFYTKDAYIPKNQYFEQHYNEPCKNRTAKRVCMQQTGTGLKCNSEFSEFDMKSVNPYTGEYQIYFQSKPAKTNKNRYQASPTTPSYL